MNIEYAINKARQIPFKRGEYRLFSVVLDSKNRVVSEACNSYQKSHTAMFHYGKCTGNPEKIYLHSEIRALIQDKKRKGVKIITARVNAKGEPCLAAPCPICTLALQVEFTNIRSIEYTIGE